MEGTWFSAASWMWLALLAGVLARLSGVSVSLVEIGVGVLAGNFLAIYGLSWLLGSTLIGVLYANSVAWVVAFAFLTEVASIPMLLYFLKSAGRTLARGTD